MLHSANVNSAYLIWQIRYIDAKATDINIGFAVSQLKSLQ